MRLQIKDATFDEEEMLNTGKADALKRIQEDIEEETQREERRLRYRSMVDFKHNWWFSAIANFQCYF